MGGQCGNLWSFLIPCGLGIADVESEQKQRIAKRGKLTEYLETLRNQGIISSFNETLWYGTVEQVRVTTEGNLRFIFRDGQEITVWASV